MRSNTNGKDTVLELIVNELMLSPTFNQFLAKRIVLDGSLMKVILEKVDQEQLTQNIANELFKQAHNRHMNAKQFLSTLLNKSADEIAKLMAEEVRLSWATAACIDMAL